MGKPNGAQVQEQPQIDVQEQPQIDEAPITVDPKTIPTNRMDRVFASVLFRPSDRATVYTDERTGVQSKQVAQVLVELTDPHTGKGSGAFVRGRIYARKKAGSKRATAEFSFMGNAGQPCIVTEDAQVKAELDAWRARVEANYKLWREANPVMETTVSGAVELDDVNF